MKVGRNLVLFDRITTIMAGEEFEAGRNLKARLCAGALSDLQGLLPVLHKILRSAELLEEDLTSGGLKVNIFFPNPGGPPILF